ncbi:MAG: YfhO family protein [Chloroflexota bacterium]|nr:YfhO family protein [Chloroflexota bacterium]
MDTIKEQKDQPRWIIKAWHGTWPMGIWTLLCIMFYWDALWLPADRIIAGNDLTNMFLHWLRFAVSSVEQGQLPLWNPYLFSGIPFIANPQPALFYPPTWLALLMPVTRAFGWIIVLHVWLAGVGMYAWLRSEGASPAGALVGGAVFAFSGYFFVRVYAGHLGVITTEAWLPLVLWVHRRAVMQRSWKLAVLGGLPVGLSILAGHSASFIYVALGLIAYAAFCAWENWREEWRIRKTRNRMPVTLPLVWAGLMLLVGLGLAAVQLLPMAELAARSTRQAAPSYDFATRFSWPPGYLLTLLVPNFFGEPAHAGYWGDGIYDEFIFYVGVLPLLLTLLGLRLRHRLTPFLLALGLGGLLLAFGKYGSLHPLFYRFVPLFRSARAPARAGFLFTLAAAAMAGLMVTALQSSALPSDPSNARREQKRGGERARLLEPLKWQLVLTVTGGTLALVVTGFAAFAWGRESNPAAGRLWHQANQVALFLLFFLLSVGLLTTWRSAPARHTGLGLLALGLVVLDLWTFGGGLIEAEHAHGSAYWRKISQTVGDPQTTRVLPWDLNDFAQNGGMLFGLRSVFGYDPLVLQRYEEFITSRPDPRARTYDLLNAGYFMTTAPIEYPDQPDAPRLVLDEPDVYVYERSNALPRAWIVSQVEVMDDAAMLTRIHEPDFDPRTTALVNSPLECAGTAVSPAPPVHGSGGQVEIVRYDGNRIEAQVRGGGGLLIFSEVDYPGWQATVDGDAAQLVRADYLLRAFCVPAGEHRVVLVYDPPLLKIGLAITGLTLLLILSVIWNARPRGGRA